ncbi:AAA family ATPase [Amycolatopsis sp. NPDC049252]|uniref:ATP-binding protein n=1 Tax=Amycolatopsis sp. NPDC049252 TaxID=3363933 RepID=UPI00371671AE
MARVMVANDGADDDEEDGRTAFVGRGAELDHLKSRADRVAAGRPQLVWLEGPTGIGKSALLDRFVAGLTGFTLVAADGDPAESSLPYGLIDQLVSGSGPAGHGRHRPDPDPTPITAGARLLALLGELQAAGPVALVLDDVQWTDPFSAQALGFALRRVTGHRVLTLLALRVPGRDGDVPTATGHLTRNRIETTTLRVGGLSPQDIRALSVLTAGRDLPLPTAAKLHRHTDGNPAHVGSLLSEVDHRLLIDATDTLPVPGSVLTAVGPAVRRLPPESRRLVDALAVLGGRFPLARVAQLARVSGPAQALVPALEAGIVRWWPSDPTNQVTMSHPLYRDAVYQLLSPPRRAQLHATAAALVDHSSSWAHRVAAAVVADGRLAAELERESVTAANAARHDVAAQYLRWAAELSDSRSDHERRFLGACLHMLVTANHVWTVGRRAEIEACRPSPLRDCVLGMTLLFGIGDLATAAPLLARTESAIDAPAWLRGTAAASLAALHLWAGGVSKVLDASSLALAAPGLPDRLRDFVRALRAVARTRRDGLRSGFAELGHVPERADAVTAADLESLCCRGSLHAMLGEYEEAVGDLSAALRLLPSRDGIPGGMAPHCYLAASHYALGDWTEATAVADQAIGMQDTSTQPAHHVLSRLVATLVPAASGDFGVALEHAAAARSRAEALGTPQDLRYAAIAGALVARAMGDRDGMVDALHLVEHSPARRVWWWDTWWRPLRVETLLDLGELDDAESELREFEQSAVDVAHTGDELTRLWAGLATRRGSPDQALEICAARMHEPGRAGLPLPRAMLEHGYGRLLLSAGFQTEARMWLTVAYRRFAVLGARPYARRAERDLRLCDPKATARTSGLTDREEQVGKLVALGLTNREIATELYISTKTVEYHISNLYAKLGVASRKGFKRLHDRP